MNGYQKTKHSQQLQKESMDAEGENLYIVWACGQLHENNMAVAKKETWILEAQFFQGLTIF